MICDSCHGTGQVMRDSLPVFGVMPGDPDRPPPGASIWLPCPECGGSGRAHCCEGERPGNDRPMAWKTGDRVRLIRTDICGTMAEQPNNEGELPTFIWVTWDDGMESWVDPDTLERP